MTNDERDTKINEIHTAVQVLVSQIQRHERSLYGNGSPGLCTRVQKIEDKHENESREWASIISLIMSGCAIIGLLWKILG